MVRTVGEWRDAGEYLPECLRDFHDQKDLFKALHALINVKGHPYAKDVSWISGQCYVIDVFLWWMAKHGYTLQRSRAKVSFDDLDEAVEQARNYRNKTAAKAMGLTPAA